MVSKVKFVFIIFSGNWFESEEQTKRLNSPYERQIVINCKNSWKSVCNTCHKITTKNAFNIFLIFSFNVNISTEITNYNETRDVPFVTTHQKKKIVCLLF